jgi:hypothetical protein
MFAASKFAASRFAATAFAPANTGRAYIFASTFAASVSVAPAFSTCSKAISTFVSCQLYNSRQPN